MTHFPSHMVFNIQISQLSMRSSNCLRASGAQSTRARPSPPVAETWNVELVSHHSGALVVWRGHCQAQVSRNPVLFQIPGGRLPKLAWQGAGQEEGSLYLCPLGCDYPSTLRCHKCHSSRKMILSLSSVPHPGCLTQGAPCAWLGC